VSTTTDATSGLTETIVPRRRRRRLSRLCRLIGRPFLQFLALLVHLILLLVRIMASLLLSILNSPLPLSFLLLSPSIGNKVGSTPAAHLDVPRVKDRSTLGQQLELRLRALCRWPNMWLRTRYYGDDRGYYNNNEDDRRHIWWELMATGGRWLKNDAFSNIAYLYFWSSVVQVNVSECRPSWWHHMALTIVLCDIGCC
jgi:hypothetical protein